MADTKSPVLFHSLIPGTEKGVVWQHPRSVKDISTAPFTDMLAVAEVRPDKNTLSLPQYNRVVTKARYVSQLRWTPFMVLDPVYVIPGLIKAEVER